MAEVCRISKTGVSNAQYTEFLNAVAMTDPNALYNVRMGSIGIEGRITRSGSPGSFTYSTIASRKSVPVVHASFYYALQLTNRLHNGQPIAAQRKDVRDVVAAPIPSPRRESQTTRSRATRGPRSSSAARMSGT